MRRFLSKLVFVFVLASAAPAVAEVELTRTQVLAFAIQTLQSNEPAKALALTEAVLAANPEDAQAHILRARALHALARSDDAREAAQKGYALAETDSDKFSAALVLAEALAADGRRTQSQFWLRRAHDLAATPAQAAAAAQRFRKVRAENPVSYQFAFSAAPNNNLQNSVTTALAPGLTPVLYSGITAEIGASVSYRFSQTETSQTSAGLKLQAALNWMDPDSRADAAGRGVGAHDFDYVSAAATLRHVQEAGPGVMVLSASAGHSWYGWASYAWFATAGAEYRLPMAGGDDRLTLFANGKAQFFTDPADPPVYEINAGAGYRHALASGDAIEVTATGTANLSDSAFRKYFGGKLAVGYDLSQPILGADLSLGAYVAYRDYPDYAWGGTQRKDWRYGVSVEAELPNMATMGFMPVVSARYDQVSSSTPIFDSAAFKFGIGVRSQF